MDLFVYGTLMEPEVVRQLTGHNFHAEPARLPGFRRIHKPGTYSYIIASDADSVDGLLLQGLDDDALRALDHYEDEGHLYFRTNVVAVTGSRSFPCQTYVGNPAVIGTIAR